MNKSELVGNIASSSGVTKADATRVLDAFMMTVQDAVQQGDQVVLPGFGSFSTVNRSARKGRNPQSGEEIQIPASRSVKFKPGKKLKEAVQDR